MDHYLPLFYLCIKNLKMGTSLNSPPFNALSEISERQETLSIHSIKSRK